MTLAERTIMSKKNLQQNNFDLSERDSFPIMDILPTGKENAISTGDLVKVTGCTSSRDLRESIARERNAGAIICSGSGGGYWRPKNRQEIKEFCHNMESRAFNILEAAKSAKEALKVPDGQLKIPGGELYAGSKMD